MARCIVVTERTPLPPAPKRRTLAEHEAAVLAAASCFYATRFLGRGKYDTRKCASLDEARRVGKEMGGALIYAYAHPHQVLVETC